MKISKIHLTNFKRFTNLIVDNIPSTSKLVLLIGSNGSGKSSLFDAFGFMDTAIKENYGRDDEFWNYYSIENYLYHPDNLLEYCNSKNKVFDKEEYIAQLTEAKNRAKDAFISTLALKRTEYPYFEEPEHNGKALQNRFKNKGENEEQSAIVAGYLNSVSKKTHLFSIF